MRSDGRVEKSFTYEGRRYHVYGTSEKDAIIKMANKIRDLEEQRVTLSKSMTVEAWARKAVDTYKTGQKEITREKFIQRMNHCILEQIGSMQIGKVKPVHCQNVLNLQTGKSKTQINEVYQTLQFIFRTAVENEIIPKSPAEHLQKPVGYKNPRRAITDQERAAFYEACERKPNLRLFQFMLECGCRTSEACELKGMDLKLIDGVPMLHIRGTKTEKSDRIVPCPQDLYDRFRTAPKFDYIFRTAGGKKLSDTSLKVLRKTLKREMNIAMGARTYRNALIGPMPLADDFEPYCFRHTYCTDLCRSGIDIRVAQRLMGHATLNMTLNIYTHVDQSDILEAAKKLYCRQDCRQNAETP